MGGPAWATGIPVCRGPCARTAGGGGIEHSMGQLPPLLQNPAGCPPPRKPTDATATESRPIPPPGHSLSCAPRGGSGLSVSAPHGGEQGPREIPGSLEGCPDMPPPTIGPLNLSPPKSQPRQPRRLKSCISVYIYKDICDRAGRPRLPEAGLPARRWPRSPRAPAAQHGSLCTGPRARGGGLGCPLVLSH